MSDEASQLQTISAAVAALNAQLSTLLARRATSDVQPASTLPCVPTVTHDPPAPPPHEASHAGPPTANHAFSSPRHTFLAPRLSVEQTSDDDAPLRPSLYPLSHKPKHRVDALEQHGFDDADLLDALRLDQFEGFYNVAAMISGMGLLLSIVRSLTEEGSLMSLHDFTCAPVWRDAQVAAALIAFLLACTTAGYGWVWLWAHKSLSWHMLLLCISAVQCSLYSLPLAVLYSTPTAPLPSASVVIALLILSLKLHSYVMTNYAMACEAAELGAVQEAGGGKGAHPTPPGRYVQPPPARSGSATATGAAAGAGGPLRRRFGSRGSPTGRLRRQGASELSLLTEPAEEEEREAARDSGTSSVSRAHTPSLPGLSLSPAAPPAAALQHAAEGRGREGERVDRTSLSPRQGLGRGQGQGEGELPVSEAPLEDIGHFHDSLHRPRPLPFALPLPGLGALQGVLPSPPKAAALTGHALGEGRHGAARNVHAGSAATSATATPERAPLGSRIISARPAPAPAPLHAHAHGPGVAGEDRDREGERDRDRGGQHAAWHGGAAIRGPAGSRRKIIRAWPANVHLPGFLYFLAVPTLVYEPRYPRTKRVRWRYVGSKVAQAGACMAVQYFLLRQFMLPVLQSPSPPLWVPAGMTATGQYNPPPSLPEGGGEKEAGAGWGWGGWGTLPLHILPLVSSAPTPTPVPVSALLSWYSAHLAAWLLDAARLTLPSMAIWLTGFYASFHCGLNATAEVLRYGDRAFHSDWWNSTRLDMFWRKWNGPVHEWCLRHLFVEPQVYARASKRTAVLTTFLVSAIAHELIFSVAFKTFRPWFFLAMALQVPLMGLSSLYTGTRRGNLLVWASLFSGQPLLELLYMREFFQAHKDLFCVQA